MVCKLDRPSPQALFDRTRGLFSANVLGGYDVIPESVEWYVVSNDYALQEEFYSIAEAQWKARDPRYMCCEDLYDYFAQYGIFPLDANFSQGYVRITGTPGATIPSPLEVVIQSQHFFVEGSSPSVMPEKGYVDLRVKAVTPGPDGNIAIKNTGGTMAVTSPGIDNRVQVLGNTFCGGAEAETCEEFRSRAIERLAYKPRANNAWLKEKLMEWPCVTRVCERGGNCCLTVPDVPGCGCTPCGCNSCTQDLNFYVFFDDTFSCGIPPECVINDINDWLFGNPRGKGLGEADIGICGEIFAPVASVIDVTVTGIQCSSPAQIAQVKERIADVFRNACPSQLFSRRSIELAIAQIVGVSDIFEVTFTDRTGNMAFNDCGDMDPECDIVPCLGEIIIAGADASVNSCNGVG